MSTHSDKLMKEFWPERCGKAKNWIEKQVKPKWTNEQTNEALAICNLIDEHWIRYANERAQALKQTACMASVWPTPANSPQAVGAGPSLAEQERIRAELESTSGSFQRIKLIMDAWCAFWFWPLDQVLDLPSRDGFLASARLLLGDEPPKKDTRTLISARLGFEIDALLAAAEGETPDTDMLADAVPWFDTTHRLAEEQHFHHWELVFTEILGPISGHERFALVVGNPPWINLGWVDSAVLCEFDPRLGVADAKSATFDRRRSELLKDDSQRNFSADCSRRAQGTFACLGSGRVYPDLTGIRPNVYKNFIVRCWSVLGDHGVNGLLHPEGIYDDPNGGHFRGSVYRRLKAHYQFRNQLQDILFADIPHREEYSINSYSGGVGEVLFRHMCNLFHPKTIRASLSPTILKNRYLILRHETASGICVPIATGFS